MDASYKLKRHEVDRLVSMAVLLGWELVEEKYLADGPQVTLYRKLPEELIEAAAAAEVEIKKTA